MDERLQKSFKRTVQRMSAKLFSEEKFGFHPNKDVRLVKAIWCSAQSIIMVTMQKP